MYPLNDSLEKKKKQLVICLKLAHLGTYQIMPIRLQEEGSVWCDRLNITLLNCSITGPRGLDEQRHQLLVDKRGTLGAAVEL